MKLSADPGAVARMIEELRDVVSDAAGTNPASA
jgi:hypothetical protein